MRSGCANKSAKRLRDNQEIKRDSAEIYSVPSPVDGNNLWFIYNRKRFKLPNKFAITCVCGYVGGVECCTWCFLLTNSPHVLQIAYRKEKFSLFLRRTSERRRNVGSSLLNFYLDRIFLFWENFQDKSQRMRLPVTFFLIGWIKIRFCDISSHNNNSMEQMEWKTSCLCVFGKFMNNNRVHRVHLYLFYRAVTQSFRFTVLKTINKLRHSMFSTLTPLSWQMTLSIAKRPTIKFPKVVATAPGRRFPLILLQQNTKGFWEIS